MVKSRTAPSPSIQIHHVCANRPVIVAELQYPTDLPRDLGRIPDIVSIQRRNEVTPRSFDGAIARGRDAAIGLTWAARESLAQLQRRARAVCLIHRRRQIRLPILR